jgi:hypothetical protein
MPGSLPKSSLECPAAEMTGIHHLVDSESIPVVQLDPFLAPSYRLIRMILQTMKNDKGRLHFPAQVDDKVFRRVDDHGPVRIFFHQVQEQVPISIAIPAGIQPILIGGGP